MNKLRRLNYKNPESYAMYKQSVQQGKIVPKSVETSQIVDMLFKYDAKRKQTVLIALQNGGLVSSFQVEQNFVSKDMVVSVQEAQGNGNQSNSTGGRQSWSNSTITKKRDRLEILQSLLTKLVDEMDNRVQNGANLPFFNSAQGE